MTETPLVGALWVTCGDDLADHLVLVADLDRSRCAPAGSGVRTVCGRSVHPAALACAPRPRCRRCREQLHDPPAAPAPPRTRVGRRIFRSGSGGTTRVGCSAGGG